MPPKPSIHVHALVVAKDNDDFLVFRLDSQTFRRVPEDQLSKSGVQLGDCCVLHIVDGNLLGIQKKTKSLKFNTVVIRESLVIVENVTGIAKKQQGIVYFEVEDFGDVAFIGNDDRLISENPQPGSEWKLKLRLLHDSERRGFLRDFEWGADFSEDQSPQLDSRPSRSRTPISNPLSRSQSKESTRSDSQYERSKQNQNSQKRDKSKQRKRSKSVGNGERKQYNWDGDNHSSNVSVYSNYHYDSSSNCGESEQNQNSQKKAKSKQRKRSKSVGNGERKQYNWDGNNHSSNVSVYSNYHNDSSSNCGETGQRNRKNSQTKSNCGRSNSRHRRSSSKTPSTSNNTSNNLRKLLITSVQDSEFEKKVWLWDIESKSTAFIWGELEEDILIVGHFFEGKVQDSINKTPLCEKYIKPLDGEIPEVKTKNVNGWVEVECTVNRSNFKNKTVYHEFFGHIEFPVRMIPHSRWDHLRIKIYSKKPVNGFGSVWRIRRIVSPKEQLIDEFRAVWTHQLFKKQIQCAPNHNSDFDEILDNYYNE